MKWHPDSRDKAKTSLWEPTKQTEEYWRRQLREESREWEEAGGEHRFVTAEDGESIGGVVPRIISEKESETFAVPDDMAKYWAAASHEEPMELPGSVEMEPPHLEDAPQYDNDVSDANEDAWASEIVKERAVRIHSCFGLVLYLQPRLEWARTTYKVVFYRNQLEESDGKWFPAGPRTSYTEGYSDKQRYGAHRRLYTLNGPERINNGLIEQFTGPNLDEDGHTPKPAGWRPHVPNFWGTRFPGDDADVGHYDYWTWAGKRQPHIMTPWHYTNPRFSVYGFPIGPIGFRLAGPVDPVPMPWNNPAPGKVEEWWALAQIPGRDFGASFMSRYLAELLFMNDYIVTDPYDEDKPQFAMRDVEGRRVEGDRSTRRLRLTASCGYRYAKSWECMDHRIMQKLVTEEMATWELDEAGRLVCVVDDQDADYQLDTWEAGEDEIPIRGVPFRLDHWQTKRNYGVTFRPKINLRWETRRRDRRWDFRPEKLPGYRLHCSAQSIMAITGCSRATAFRWIEKFMAETTPEPELWTPAVYPAPDPGTNRGLVTLPGQTFHCGGLLGPTRMARYGQSTIPARGGNVRTKILLHIQLHNLSRTHPNCPKRGSPQHT